MEHVSRNFLPNTEVFGENRIALGPPNHMQEAKLRNASAMVSRNRAYDFPISARDKLVGHHIRNKGSFCNCQKMRLALCSSIGDQGLVINSLGVPKHWTRYINTIVKGKFLNDIGGRFVGMCQSLREVGSG